MSDDSGVGGAIAALFAAGPAAGTFIYAGIKRKYRNRDARYRPESSVGYELKTADLEETKLRTIVSRDANISGRNDRTPHNRAPNVSVTKD